MRNEFTAIVEQDGPWFIAYCAEVPAANGQGRTREECLAFDTGRVVALPVPTDTSDTVEVMDFPEHIEVRSDVMMGKPCLKGTRIPVYLILEKLAAGETGQDILAAYPQLRPEHVKASLEYAARLAANEIVLANQ